MRDDGGGGECISELGIAERHRQALNDRRAHLTITLSRRLRLWRLGFVENQYGSPGPCANENRLAEGEKMFPQQMICPTLQIAEVRIVNLHELAGEPTSPHFQ